MTIGEKKKAKRRRKMLEGAQSPTFAGYLWKKETIFKNIGAK